MVAPLRHVTHFFNEESNFPSLLNFFGHDGIYFLCVSHTNYECHREKLPVPTKCLRRYI
jgi:hypothetical protein